MNDISCDKLEVHVSYYNKDIYEQYASIEPRSKKKKLNLHLWVIRTIIFS